MAFKDLRQFLARLQEIPGEVVSVKEELSPLFEISAVLKEVASRDDGPVVIFEHVKGYPATSVVGNVLGTRKRLAIALDTTEDNIGPDYVQRLENPIKPVLVANGPACEVVVKDDDDLLAVLPIMTYSERDSGPFISAGVCIGKDPETGTQSMGIHRLEVKGKNRLGILLANPPLATFLAKAEAANAPLEMAVAVGVDPVVDFSSVVQVTSVVDKFDIAGALRRAPVELVKAQTVDLAVPATAEVVIEGRIQPGVREVNGPFGESTGYYLTYDTPIIEVTAVTHRRNPIYRVIEPWSREGDSLFIGTINMLFRNLKALVPSIQAINFLPGSVGGTCVISLKRRSKGESKRVLTLVLGMTTRIKRAIVVDDDVNINDPREVEWALATRFQPDEDLIVVANTDALVIDPSARPGRVGGAMGMDACKPFGNPPEFDKIRAPQEHEERAKELLRRYL
ncbi:MAG: UbiD family decarboxylase [Chloroflexi bacterium]|nr:UbiD family decarboxylase [Chloroflexota bacterium]